MITKPVARIVVACARELDRLGADWAIGGAVAMAAQGYVRATGDVDLFVGDDVRAELLAALRKRSIPVIETMEPVHYTIIPDRTKPDSRVDLLFPALGIETLAMMAATRLPLFGKRLPVWPLPHIVAHKLATDPEVDADRAAKDASDLRELRARGLVDTLKIAELLDDVRDGAAKTRLFELMRPAPKRRPRA